MTILVDTGVLLRILDRRDPEHQTILAVFRSFRARRETLVTTTQNLREFWNVSTRPATARGGYGRSVEQTALWLRRILRVLPVLPEDEATFARWQELVERYAVVGTQVHDANLVAIAEVHGVDQILTLNPVHFARYGTVIPITLPQALGV